MKITMTIAMLALAATATMTTMAQANPADHTLRQAFVDEKGHYRADWEATGTRPGFVQSRVVALQNRTVTEQPVAIKDVDKPVAEKPYALTGENKPAVWQPIPLEGRRYTEKNHLIP